MRLSRSLPSLPSITMAARFLTALKITTFSSASWMMKNLAAVTAWWLIWKISKKFDEGYDTYIVDKQTILNVKDIRRRGQNPDQPNLFE